MTDRPWAEALEMQYLAAAEALRIARELEAAKRGLETLGSVRLMARKLRGATTYVWAPAIAGAVAQAAASLPDDVALTPDTLPEPSCWWWFGTSPWTTVWTPVGEPKTPTPICALQLFRCIDSDSGHLPEGVGVRFGPATGLPGVQFLVWTFPEKAYPNEAGLWPTTTCFWYEGETLAQLRARLAGAHTWNDARRQDAARFAPFLLAGGAWLQQTILVTEAGAVDRPLRRRIAREHQLAEAPGDVRIVQLRRREHAPSTGAGDHVEWSCQWVVSGHWRHQPYERGARHQLKWINPYVKGPEDKPLRLPKQTVYEVKR